MAGRLGCLALVVLLVAAGFFLGRDYVRGHPQDFPWTALDLAHPVGRFTASKIAALGEAPAQCRSLLAAARLEDGAAPPRIAAQGCGYRDGMRLAGRNLDYLPTDPITACPVAAALHLLEMRVIDAAARDHLGQRVTAIDHAGSYSCRRLYGRSGGAFSQHATADAIDILGFRLADGTRVSVLNDWTKPGPRSAFLHAVRDGACDLFSTVLSPDYNQAHADHLHFDVADRGTSAWSLCR